VDVFEAMETCRAIRFLKPDPVPEELIEKLVWAGTRAPSPGNSQGWDFVVVTDPAKKQAIGDAVAAVMAPRVEAMRSAPGTATEQRMLAGAAHLATSLSAAPVLLFVCGPVIYPPERPQESFTWSAVYPAAQNVILAARALGLGATFTTFHGVAEPIIRTTLGIPDHVKIGVMIPLGWPDQPFGPLTRLPIDRFLHRDGWQGDLRG
jgi:nitroreductase